MKYGLGENLHYLTKEFRQKKEHFEKKKEIKCKITCIKHSYFEKTPNQLTFHKLSFKNILGYLTIKWF